MKYSASSTPNAFVGYGAGFWTNLGDSMGAHYRIENGWPRDAFLAKGSIGQFVIVIPSQHLVIARKSFRQEFQGHTAAQLCILGLIHHTHAATAQLSQNPVMGDGSTDHVVDARPWQNASQCGQGGIQDTLQKNGGRDGTGWNSEPQCVR